MIMLHESPRDYHKANASLFQRKRREQNQFWDGFYQRHCRAFFKDRHYLIREFPLLMTGNPTILELGCGVGNTTLPLSEENASAFVHCCDYSAVAVKLLKQDDRYNPDRMRAFVADITKAGSLSGEVPAGSVDVATAIFVLSANSPDSLHQAAIELKTVLKPATGTVVVRDYAAGDLAEERLSAQGQHRNISEHLYSRGDGTWCLFFTEETLCAPFLEAGFVCRDVHILNRTVVNRKSGVSMQRRFMQATFCLPPGPSESFLLPRFSSQPDCGSSGTDEEDAAVASEYEQVYAGPLQCLHAAAAISDWSAPSDFHISATKHYVQDPGCHLTSPAVKIPHESERELAEWFHQMPHILQDRAVVDLGSGSTGLCAFFALASCAHYVFLCPSLELARNIQEQIRPSSHLFVCERLRFATTADMFVTAPHAAKLLQHKPTLLIVRIGKDSCRSSEITSLLRIAAAELVQGSLAVFIDCGLCPPLDLEIPASRVDKNGLKWVLMYTGQQFKALQLTA